MILLRKAACHQRAWRHPRSCGTINCLGNLTFGFTLFNYRPSVGNPVIPFAGEFLMTDVVIVASSRTPLGKSYRGSLNMTRPDDMVAHCLQAVLAKVPEVSRDEIEDIVIGCGYPEGAQGHNVARVAAIRAGVPVTVDAGVGTASDATIAMELWADGGLMNTGIAGAQDPVAMAEAMKLTVRSGRLAYLAGRIPSKMYASASSPVEGVIGQ